MKNNIKILAITFSVVLNIVFIGSYIYYKSGLFLMQDRVSKCDHPLYKELNLSRRQLDRLRPLRKRFHAFIDEQERKIKAKQLELIGLLARKKPDRKAIYAKQREIQALQQEMQARVIKHLLKESSIFTPEQRQKFFALIRKRIKKSDGAGPRCMPHKLNSPSERKRP